MSLVKQIINTIFSKGIDSKIDPKVLPVGSLKTLENGVFTQYGTINKRFGFDVVNKTIEGTESSVQSADALSTFKDELNLYSSNRFYTYARSTDRWIDKGELHSIIAKTKAIVNDSSNHVDVSSSSINNVTAYAYTVDGIGVKYTILDETTGSYFVTDTLIAAGSYSPKVLSFLNGLVITYINSDDEVAYIYIKTATPKQIESSGVLTAELNGSRKIYDAIVVETAIVVATFSAVNRLTIQKFQTSTLAPAGTYDVNDSGITAISLAVTNDNSNEIWCTFSNATDIYTLKLSFLIVLLIAEASIETQSNVVQLSSIISNGNLQIYSEISAALSYNHYINKLVVDDTGSLVSSSEFIRSAGLLANVIEQDDEVFVPVIYQNEIQSTGFIISEEQNVVAKINNSTSGTLKANSPLTNLSRLSDTEFLLATQQKGALESENNITFSPLGVSSTILNFSSENKYQSSEIDSLYIVGGTLYSYDGSRAVEHGFNVFPEGVEEDSQSNTGGLSNGQYQYQVCYEWTDVLGQIYRSTPSIPTQVTVNKAAVALAYTLSFTSGSNVITAGSAHGLRLGQTLSAIPGSVSSISTATVTKIVSSTVFEIDINATGTAIIGTSIISKTNVANVVLDLPTLRLTSKENVRLVVYRTEANGEIFRRVSSVLSPTLNNKTVDYVTFTDNMTDYESLFSDTIYTTGGVLENVATPNCSLITTWNNRLVISGLDDPLAFWYSQQKVENTPVEFTDAFYSKVDPRGGDITALGVIDDKLIIFKKSSIFALAGQGPNALGLQSDLGVPQLITTDVGCDNPNSVVITPNGLMFKSSKGIYLLDRTLNTSYIGSPVEEYNGSLITSSTLVPNFNQIRFTTDTDFCLVYDYLFDQWGTFTNHIAEDSVVFDDKFIFVRPNGDVCEENRNTHIDDNSPIKLKIVTSWIQVASIQGFQRIYRALILGEYKSPHQLQVSVAYNFTPYDVQFKTIDVNETYLIESYGDQSPYGSEVYGGEYPLYQFKTHLTRQKCQSIRFTFEDNQNTEIGAYGEGFSLTNLALEVGVKATPYKSGIKTSFATSTK